MHYEGRQMQRVMIMYYVCRCPAGSGVPGATHHPTDQLMEGSETTRDVDLLDSETR